MRRSSIRGGNCVAQGRTRQTEQTRSRLSSPRMGERNPRGRPTRAPSLREAVARPSPARIAHSTRATLSASKVRSPGRCPLAMRPPQPRAFRRRRLLRRAVSQPPPARIAHRRRSGERRGRRAILRARRTAWRHCSPALHRRTAASRATKARDWPVAAFSAEFLGTLSSRSGGPRTYAPIATPKASTKAYLRSPRMRPLARSLRPTTRNNVSFHSRAPSVNSGRAPST